MVLVRCVKRRDLKMKWSNRTPDIKTENQRVGSCMAPGVYVSESSGPDREEGMRRKRTHVVMQVRHAALRERGQRLARFST